MKILLFKKFSRNFIIFNKYVNPKRNNLLIKNFNTKNSINNENKKLDDNLDYNSKEIIEKYKNLIRKKNIKNDEQSKHLFNQNDENKKVDNENIYQENKNNEVTESINNENIRKNIILDKSNEKLIPNKDEKYVILKKQITKEFIHQVFLPHVESQIIYHIKTYTPDQIVNIFHIYSYLYYYDKKKEMIDQLLQYLEYRLDCFSIQNVLLILEPLYILNKINNIYIYRLIINYLNKIKEKINLYNYIGISRVFTKILIDIYCEENINKKFFLTDLFQYIKQRKFRKKIPLDQRSISHKDFIIQFMNEVIEKIDSQLHLLSAVELTDLLSVISNYSYKNNYSKYNIEDDNISVDENNYNNSNNTDLNKTLKIHNLSQNNAYLFKENIASFIIIKEMINKYDELTTLHKIMNFYNLSKLCIYDEEFINLIEKDLNNYYYINNIHHKYLSLLVWCLFKFKILHKYIDKLLPIIKQNIYNFNAKGFSRLCHSIYNEKEILHKIAINLMNKIEKMNINEFLCYFYSVVLLDLLPFSVSSFDNNKESQNFDKNFLQCSENENGVSEKSKSENINNHLSILNKNEILLKCLKFINDNKKDIGKDEITKIVLLLKKKKHEKYLSILNMLPEEWKHLIHLIN
ncbi:conserved Plasmodium protein, unknown function [Plasmodium gallinaceum]|uniref:Uncharacterized protein n=1 Tax=Plasmodium gallinaceum TaxID=5849 RepID=A0A1J1GLT1_PLAGA|nr:conserved Plasmodium protein, unknown function [Plasmodium gallinaceum]CRG93337.1 conserved Plasmodium protein, unknown function [Plasmodium gallinaceum]